MSQHKIISVVGGGWSFRSVNHAKVPGYVIAVNDAAVKLRRPVDEIVSMDRLWTEYRWPFLMEHGLPFRTRQTTLQNVAWKEAGDWLRVFECDSKTVVFSDDENRLNGTNSGTCALNRAYQLRPETLYLFGYDMCRDRNGMPYWYEPYPWAAKGQTKPGKYVTWAKEMQLVASQFKLIGTKIINVSHASKIKCFDRFDPRQLGMAA